MPAAVVAALGITAGTFGAAVVTGVVIGAIAGAVIGATLALTKGGDLGDVLKGALKGAFIGGVIGGVTGGIGYLAAPAAPVTTSAAAPSAGLSPNVAYNIPAAAPTATLPGMESIAVNMPAAITPAAKEMSMAKALLYSGGIHGISSGIGAIGGAKMEGKAALELEERRAAEERAKIAANIPGEFEAQVANIEGDWWNKHLGEIKKYERPLTGYGEGLLKR